MGQKSLTLFLSFVTLALIHSTRAADDPVTVADDGQTYTLSNGIITARISRTSGNLMSLVYKGTETLDRNDRNSGYWSHSAASDQGFEKITIDPKTNNGERGEVAVKGISNGDQMGSGPGGSMIADIEI